MSNYPHEETSFPINIRKPLNTHPSQLSLHYGTVQSDYYSALESYDGDSQSIRDHLESFVDSYSHTSALYVAENVNAPYEDIYDLKTSSLSRHTTIASVISHQLPHKKPARSTFVQSVFNSVNVLVGIGILTLPFAFRCAGWVMGSLIFLFCALVTNYTAKLMAHCLDVLPHSSTYGDMGAAAFGDRGRTYVSVVFMTELMTIGVAMVVLLGDAVASLLPQLDTLSIRIGSFFILTPMLFLPIRQLAYTSLMGIISCICLLWIVLYDGFSQSEKPGSLLDPMDTEIIPSDLTNVPLCIGLMMAGFSGHAVFPAIYRDMQDPKRYEQMVDLTYVITMGIYVTMAVAGYIMFGSDTMKEITQNLALTPGYSVWINRFAVGLIVLTPIAKYGLMMNPVIMTWEVWATTRFSDRMSSFVNGVGKIMLSLIVMVIATLFPGFDRVMSLLGALFSFGISAIFPLVCYMRLFEVPTKQSILIYLILTVSICMALIGTVWSL
ncbi:transmembrane amino acid transporter protein-domain-containing protein [Choanephora cucurbitarum]|nr:transmembrane amino acid transporter protein-domain-containing protein [Choanephora cucurbitarum]